MSEIIDAEFVDMPEDGGSEPRCAVIILPDTSGSMTGEPIAELNEGLQTFHHELQADGLSSRRCEVSLMEFGGGVQTVQDFVLASDMPAPPQLTAGGQTPMGAALDQAIQMIRDKKEEYRRQGRSQYRPWIFMITDGQPTDDVSPVVPLIHEGDEEGSFLFFAVGCLGANMEMLKRIAPPSTPPVYLKGTDFTAMFKWLSDSLGAVSGSTPGQQLQLPSIGNWGQLNS